MNGRRAKEIRKIVEVVFKDVVDPRDKRRIYKEIKKRFVDGRLATK